MSRTSPIPTEMSAHAAAAAGCTAARAGEAQLMRDHLARLKPHSGSEALRALREAFPSTSLAARVAAMSHHAGQTP